MTTTPSRCWCSVPGANRFALSRAPAAGVASFPSPWIWRWVQAVTCTCWTRVVAAYRSSAGMAPSSATSTRARRFEKRNRWRSGATDRSTSPTSDRPKTFSSCHRSSISHGSRCHQTPPTTSVGQALEAADGSDVTVSGFLIAWDGINSLCSGLLESSPPQCGGDRIDLLDFDASSVPNSKTPQRPSEIPTDIIQGAIKGDAPPAGLAPFCKAPAQQNSPFRPPPVRLSFPPDSVI